MSEHPWIDFNGDGQGDRYETAIDNHGHYGFLHHDAHGHIDAIAYDNNGDGLIDSMAVDENHDGTIDTMLSDTNHDGYMDHRSPYGTDTETPVEHPYVDFNGDGRGDSYDSYNDGQGHENFVHHDRYGRVDAVAQDGNHDGRVDRMWADENHDGGLDHLLTDSTGDGVMDGSVAI